ncbi:uncharacterized protein isoform X2 [Rhodnius prolixus]|uniref:uncharacterized protein isoform X2 n=1 Tax=Rhodnius prolixus TaxID=13249 RepID=UPI003D18AB2F
MFRVWKKFGPSQYVIKSLEKCESTEGHKLMLDKYRITKFNRTVYTYNGNMTLIEELTNEGTEINFSFEVWGNGGWKKNFFNKRFKNTCSVLEQYSPKYVEAIKKQTNITGCPLPVGTYEFKDLVINLDMAVSMPYGLYRTTVEFFKDSEIFFCMRLILDVLPVK